jgi:hypothetical protein
MAVGGRTHDGLGGNVGARARPVLDNARLAEPLGQPLTHQARDEVCVPARWKSDDPAHGSCRVSLRACNTRSDRKRGSTRCKIQKVTARTFHLVRYLNSRHAGRTRVRRENAAKK